MTLTIEPVALLSDNYAYLLIDAETKRAVVVDPSEAAPVELALRDAGLELEAIWLTHHHYDHVGGVAALVEKRPGLPVLGGAYDLANERIAGQTRALAEGDFATHGGVRFEVLEIPGHTLGAIAYVGGGLALTGDTLFLGGCGRVFEGTMPMMRASLERLRALPPETRIYPGHEYTVRNLEFARIVEPGEHAIEQRLERARAMRAEKTPTVGATIGEERATNPFLRWDSRAVQEFAKGRGPATNDDEIFARIREAKDTF